jgi:hypothetical protein
VAARELRRHGLDRHALALAGAGRIHDTGGVLMKPLTIIGLVLMALFALGAFTAGTAMALEEGVLPNANFTGTGGVQLLETLGGENITCTALNILEGRFNAGSDDEGTANLHYTGCTGPLGLAFNSLGDEAKVVLQKVKFTICLINSPELKFGIAIEAIEKPFHIEIPGLGALLLINGLVIAELEGAGTKGKEFKDKLSGTKGDPLSALKCEALGKTFTYNYALAKDSAKEDEHASWNSSFTLKFEKEVAFED